MFYSSVQCIVRIVRWISEISVTSATLRMRLRKVVLPVYLSALGGTRGPRVQIRWDASSDFFWTRRWRWLNLWLVLVHENVVTSSYTMCEKDQRACSRWCKKKQNRVRACGKRWKKNCVRRKEVSWWTVWISAALVYTIFVRRQHKTVRMIQKRLDALLNATISDETETVSYSRV